MFQRRLKLYSDLVGLKYGLVTAFIMVYIADKVRALLSVTVVFAIVSFVLAAKISTKVFNNRIVRGVIREYVAKFVETEDDISSFILEAQQIGMRQEHIDYFYTLIDEKNKKEPD